MSVIGLALRSDFDLLMVVSVFSLLGVALHNNLDVNIISFSLTRVSCFTTRLFMYLFIWTGFAVFRFVVNIDFKVRSTHQT